MILLPVAFYNAGDLRDPLGTNVFVDILELSVCVDFRALKDHNAVNRSQLIIFG
jgi:hypothetical protein